MLTLEQLTLFFGQLWGDDKQNYLSVCQVVEGDVVQQGIAFAKAIIDKPIDPRRISKMKVKIPPNVRQIFDGENVSQRNVSRWLQIC